MTVSEVLALLDAERDERGMSNWEKLGSSTAGMRSYGIGLTHGCASWPNGLGATGRSRTRSGRPMSTKPE
jgi:hypothetical protein